MTKKIGIIGYGSIGQKHYTNLTALGCDVKIYDPAMAITNYSATFLDELGEWADAIAIASPTSLHRTHLTWAGKLGKPIFCEKPIADVKIDIPNTVLMVGYNLRFHAVVQRASNILTSKVLGHPFWAHFTVSQKSIKPIYLRDGVILNWSHEIDLALHLLGPAKVVASSTHTVSHYDDQTDLLLIHDNGCRSVIHLDYLGEPEVRTFRVLCSKGNLSANLVKPRCCQTDPAEGEGTFFLAHDSFDQNYKAEMQAFLDRIDQHETLGATAQDAMAVLDICLEVRKQAGLP